MTRLELLQLLIGQARQNGFKFKKWYVSCLGLAWEDSGKALHVISAERRYYALLFSHDFASTFWKAGEPMTFQVSAQSFTRIMANGSVGTVVRKSHTRRTTREDAWKYHLKELAVAEDPLRYMRRYLNVSEDLDETSTATKKSPKLNSHPKPSLNGRRPNLS